MLYSFRRQKLGAPLSLGALCAGVAASVGVLGVGGGLWVSLAGVTTWWHAYMIWLKQYVMRSYVQSELENGTMTTIEKYWRVPGEREFFVAVTPEGEQKTEKILGCVAIVKGYEAPSVSEK